MAGEEPPYLSVGTDVSAKYKGAFCEAKVKKVVRSVKCKVTFKNNLGTVTVSDDHVKGTLRVGAHAEVKHPEKNQYFEAIINKLHDQSQYTVVFDDGDETTLRRTSLCLKSGRHFAESETLDQLPLTHPEHFGTPVIGSKGRKRRSLNRSTNNDDGSSDDGSPPKKKEAKHREPDPDIGKVVCVELGDKKKMKDNWFPALVVSVGAQDAFKINPKEEYLIRSFKDGKYHCVLKKETKPFTWEIGAKVDNNTLKTAVEKASLYTDRDELPPHWDRDILFGANNSDNAESNEDSDSDTSDDEPSEEKDRFVAQLYKFMDDRGTPINKAPTVSNRDLNLCRLFKLVQKLGGYNRVTNHMQWKTVYTKMGLPGYSTSSSHQIKQAYKKYLHSFEDFYRKLGCTMGTSTRSGRMRHRSDRSFILTRDRDREFKAAGRRLAKQEAKKKEEKAAKEEVEEKVENIEKGKEKEVEKAKEMPAESKVEKLAEEQPESKAKTKEEKKPKPKKERLPEKKIKMEKEEKPKIKGRKKHAKDENGNESKEQESTDEGETFVDIDIHVGDKVRVKYGRGRHQKIYEAKVLEVEEEDGEKHYYVHYTGWNMRYDEWVKRHRIVENLSQKARKGRSAGSPKNLHSKQSFTRRGRPPTLQGKPGSQATQKRANSLSSPRSRSTRSDKNSLAESPFANGLEPRKRTRKSSGLTNEGAKESDDSGDESDSSEHNSVESKKERHEDLQEKEFGGPQQDSPTSDEKKENRKTDDLVKKSPKKARKPKASIQLPTNDDAECDGDIDDDDDQEPPGEMIKKKKKPEDSPKKGKRKKKVLEKEQPPKPEQVKPRRRMKKVKVEEVSDGGSVQESPSRGSEAEATPKSVAAKSSVELSGQKNEKDDGVVKVKRRAKKKDVKESIVVENDKDDTLNDSLSTGLSEKDTSTSLTEIDESFSNVSLGDISSLLDTSGSSSTTTTTNTTTVSEKDAFNTSQSGDIVDSPRWEKMWQEPIESEKKEEHIELPDKTVEFVCSTPTKSERAPVDIVREKLLAEEETLESMLPCENVLIKEESVAQPSEGDTQVGSVENSEPPNIEVVEPVVVPDKENTTLEEETEPKSKPRRKGKLRKENDDEANELSETDSEKKAKARQTKGIKKEKTESIEETAAAIINETLEATSLLEAKNDTDESVDVNNVPAVSCDETTNEKIEVASGDVEIKVESEEPNDRDLSPSLAVQADDESIATALTEISSSLITKQDYSTVASTLVIETVKLVSLNEPEPSSMIETVAADKETASFVVDREVSPVVVKEEAETSLKVAAEVKKKVREEKKGKDEAKKPKDKPKKTKKCKAKKDELLLKTEKEAEKRDTEKVKKKENKKKKDAEKEKKKEQRLESDPESLDSVDLPRRKDKRKKNKQEEKKKEGDVAKKKSRKKSLKDHKTSDEKTSDEDSKDTKKSGKKEKLGKVKKRRDKNKKESLSDDHEASKVKSEKEHSKKTEKRSRQDLSKQTIDKFILNVRSDVEIDEVINLLICRENVPMSPVAGDVQAVVAEPARHPHPSYMQESQFNPPPAPVNMVLPASSSASSSSNYTPLNLRTCEGESSFNSIFHHDQESSTVLDNTPPTTPESALSTLSGSGQDCDSVSPPRDEESNKSGQDSMGYLSMRSNYEVNKLVCHEHVDFAQNEAAMVLGSMGVQGFDKRVSMPTCASPLTKRPRCDFTDVGTKKKRRSRRRSHSSNDTGKESINSPRHDFTSSMGHKMTASDSDEVANSDHPSSSGYPMPIFSSSNSSSCSVSSYSGLHHEQDRLRLSVVPHSTRPSKFNFHVELDESSDASQRISLLQNKLSELRKTYMALKAEVACIDRRRKKLRKKEKEAASTATPVCVATAELECS